MPVSAREPQNCIPTLNDKVIHVSHMRAHTKAKKKKKNCCESTQTFIFSAAWEKIRVCELQLQRTVPTLQDLVDLQRRKSAHVPRLPRI